MIEPNTPDELDDIDFDELRRFEDKKADMEIDLYVEGGE